MFLIIYSNSMVFTTEAGANIQAHIIHDIPGFECPNNS